MAKIIKSGLSCEGAVEGYLNVFIENIEQFVYYTNYPPYRWQIKEIVTTKPNGQYWVAITYQNTGTRNPGYNCGDTKYASVFRTEKDRHYSKVKGEIIGIIYDQKRYQSAATYKLRVKIINGRIIDYELVDDYYGNRSLKALAICDSGQSSTAYPGSMQIVDIIPITGGYEYQLLIVDDKGEQFKKTFTKIPTVDDYCIYPPPDCPTGTCSCDCHPDYTCCYGRDGKVKKIIYKK